MALAIALNACGPATQTAPEASADAPDLCIDGGLIYTGVQDAAPAHGLSVKNGKITAIETEQAQGFCDPFKSTATQIVNLDGSSLYPGFVDAHAHLLGIGLREMTLNLEGTASIKALKQRLAEVVAETADGDVIYGRGWIETHWPENRFPTRQDLDAVAPNNPVILRRADGHSLVANSKALEAAGITKDTDASFGGSIIAGKDGHPSGMLIDNAMDLATVQLGALSPQRKEAAYIKASEVYAAYGWTGIQSMSVDPEDVPLIERLSQEGKLKIRVYNAVDMQNADQLLDAIAANGPQHNENAKVTTRSIKLYADGALGSRGAALLVPYADDPGNEGLMLTNRETIMPILERALRDGFQICTHAIGDKANRLVLDWYEQAFDNVPVAERKHADPRWRIEHSQIIDLSDLQRFAQLGVIASMQPSHAIGDLHFAPDRLGVERLKGGYAWRTLIDSGAKIAAGSDAPVERGDPRIEFYGAVARKDAQGFSGEGWYPEQKVSRAEALTMLTAWPAFAAFEDGVAGTIELGKNADFTVFSGDIMTVPEAEILNVTTAMTIVAGEIIYQQ